MSVKVDNLRVYYRTLRGDVLLDGTSILALPPRERAHVVGHVGQDPASGFVTDTVEEEPEVGPEARITSSRVITILTGRPDFFASISATGSR